MTSPSPLHAERPLALRTTVPIGSLDFAPWSGAQVCAHVFGELAKHRGGWIVTANVDFLQRAERDPQVRALYRAADLVLADGFPLIWASRLAGRPLPARVAGSDLVWELASGASAGGHSLYLLGGAPGAANRAAERLARRWPELRLVGCSSPGLAGPPTPDQLEWVEARLRRAKPDLVYVGLGSPKQEQLIEVLRPRFPETWFVGCGISLSFMAGDVQRAPAWLQRAGLEWLHRLCGEPGRLAGRYARNLPYACALLARSLRLRERFGGASSEAPR